MSSRNDFGHDDSTINIIVLLIDITTTTIITTTEYSCVAELGSTAAAKLVPCESRLAPITDASYRCSATESLGDESDEERLQKLVGDRRMESCGGWQMVVGAGPMTASRGRLGV